MFTNMRSSLNSRETKSRIAANSRLKPKSSPVLVRSEELVASSGKAHFVKPWITIDRRGASREEVKLTMIVDLTVDERMGKSVDQTGLKEFCVMRVFA